MGGDLPPQRFPELVQLVCGWAAERDESLTPVRLVKFLYLADLYHARKTGGRTLTGWPWAFIHFGPYCSESLQAVDQAVAAGLISRQTYESRYSGEENHSYRGRRQKTELAVERLIDAHSTYTTIALRQAVRRWADDTAGLLTHVYFETEPMENIEPFSILNFKRAVPPPKIEKVAPLPLAPDRKKIALEALAALKNRSTAAMRRTPVDTGPHDQAFLEALGSSDVVDGQAEFSGVVGFGELRQPDSES